MRLTGEYTAWLNLGRGNILLDLRPRRDQEPNVSRLLIRFPAQNQVFMGSPGEGPAPQSRHELTEGCEEGSLGRAYRTAPKGPQGLSVTLSGVHWHP